MLTKLVVFLLFSSKIYCDLPEEQSSVSKTNDETLAKVHSYCLFHVDLNCHTSCIGLGFTNGKCYKGVCVCKGSEKKALRKLRLSGQMIVPYMLSANDTFGEHHNRIAYDKAMLDTLVEAGREMEDDTTLSNDSRDDRDDPLHTENRYHKIKSVDDGSTLGFIDSTEYMKKAEGGIPDSSVKEEQEEVLIEKENVNGGEEGELTIVSESHLQESKGILGKHRLRHHNHHNIFKLGNPRNLRGTILSVAKEYDPQHLFSGEESKTSPSSIIDKVIIEISGSDSKGKIADDVAGIISKLEN